MTRRVVILGALLFVLLGTPRRSEAGFFDFIWEMSGPQMFGYSVGCVWVPATKTWEQCRLQKNPLARDRNTSESNGPYLGFSTSIFGSTGGLDPNTRPYDFVEVGMWEAGGDVSFRSYQTGGPSGHDVQVYHGVGLAYERFFGDGVTPFWKIAITATPLEVALKKYAIGIKCRLYPKGFSSDEFKTVPTDQRQFEATVGFTLSFLTDKPVKQKTK